MPQEIHQVLAPYISSLDQQLSEQDHQLPPYGYPAEVPGPAPNGPYGPNLPPVNVPPPPANNNGAYPGNWQPAWPNPADNGRR